ncbi:MAG: response regulator transcription factor [Cyanobacteriota bacterium]
MKNIRVMLADDHTVFRQGLKSLLALEEDIKVVSEAANGQEAIDFAKQLHPDVIIMDINMPILNGLEATKQVKKELAKTKIIILTSQGDDKSVFSLIEAGADGYLLKDVAAENLVSAIRDVFAGKSILHPEVTKKLLTQFVFKGEPEKQKPGDLLTEREIEVLKALSKGYSNQQIAEELYISQRTVQNHLHNIYNKLGINGRTEAVIYAIQEGIISKE